MGETKSNSFEAIKQIFDKGTIRNQITPCYIEWLSRLLKKGYWKLTVIPFVETNEQRQKWEWGDSTYACGYYQFYGSDGFRDQPMNGRGSHENLHQIIHCLNKYREVAFSDIEIEHPIDRRNHWDILAKTTEKTVVAQLGTFGYHCYESAINEFDEFWFNGGREFFYCLQLKRKVPQEESFYKFMKGFFQEKACCESGQSYNCWNYSNHIHGLCASLRRKS